MTETQMLKEGHPYCCTGGGALEVSVGASELGGESPWCWTMDSEESHTPAGVAAWGDSMTVGKAAKYTQLLL